MSKRTDLHRPSVIEPADYAFIGLLYAPTNGDPLACLAVAEERKRVMNFIQEKGYKWAQTGKGGCDVCGTAIIYQAVYLHVPSGTVLRIGFDCADNMDIGEAEAFRHYKKRVGEWKTAQAGKAKAEGILTEMGCKQAWEIYTAEDKSGHKEEEGIICDIVGKLVRYGQFYSEKQANFLQWQVEKVNKRAEIQAKRDAERALAADCPEGRQLVDLMVIKTKYSDGPFGGLKMTCKHADGWLLYCSVPSALDCVEVPKCDSDGHKWTEQRGLKYGDKIRMKITIKQSDRDSKFGFGKRPSNAEVLELAAAE